MELHSSNREIASTVLTNGPGGTPLYHIHTKSSIRHTITTISRVKPSAAQDPVCQSEKDNDIKQIAKSETGVREQARIEWSVWGRQKICYGGREWKASEFMQSGGIGGMNRTFTGQDGFSYTWHTMNSIYLTVSTPSNSKLEVARFHNLTWSFHKKPYLYIAPEAMHMLDMIVLTGVFVAAKQKSESEAATDVIGGVTG